MLKKYIPVVVALGIVALLSSCAKEGPTGPTGPAGPTYIGAISGHVSLYDQYGSQVLANLVKVQLLLSRTGDTIIHPDVNGLYSYTNVATGNYSIAVADSGYGATVVNSFQFVSGTLNKDIKMSAIPAFTIDSFSVSENTALTSDSITIHLAADARVRNCIVFVGSASTVSNAVSNYLLAYVKQIPANVTAVPLIIPAQDLYNANLAKGSAVYYAAYSYVVNDVSVYEDLTSGKKVYNAVGTALTPVAGIVP